MVVHQVGTVVLELGVVAIRRQRFIDKHQARIRAIRDTALSTRFAAATCRSAIAGIHHVRHQQVARAQQVIAHLIDVKAIGGAFGLSLAVNQLKTGLQLAVAGAAVVNIPGQIRRDICVVVHQVVIAPDNGARLEDKAIEQTRLLVIGFLKIVLRFQTLRISRALGCAEVILPAIRGVALGLADGGLPLEK